MKTVLGAPVKEYLPALGFLAFTILYLAMAYSYETDARAFPSGVAWVMLVLTLLDLITRTKTPVGIALLQILNPAAEEAGPARGIEVDPMRQIRAILWIFGFAILLYVLGILAAVPVYAFVFMRFRSKLSCVTSIGVAALTTAGIYALFGLALHIDFYPGLFFDY
jgi:hypothetical protein